VKISIALIAKLECRKMNRLNAFENNLDSAKLGRRYSAVREHDSWRASALSEVVGKAAAT
jgi:hypothetical protein